MKKLPRTPYLQNIVKEWHNIKPIDPYLGDDYRNWLKTHGFTVPIQNECLEFPDDFSDDNLLVFILKWS